MSNNERTQDEEKSKLETKLDIILLSNTCTFLLILLFFTMYLIEKFG